jgi:hypothetical protein
MWVKESKEIYKRKKQMKHLRIYEDYQMETMPVETSMSGTGFETESTEIKSITGSEGNYMVSFTNSEGEETSIEIGGATSPEFTGDSMVSSIEMIPGSSSDGKSYKITGYYSLSPEGHGAYTLDNVLIKEI